MSTRLIIVGAGGFGRETLDVVEAINLAAAEPVFDLLGVVDANPSALNLARLEARGIPYLGKDSDWLVGESRAAYLIGVGSPEVRQRIDAAYTAAGFVAAVAVHPSATIGSAVRIGQGSIVCAGVQVSTNVSLGRHVHLNPNVTVGHDANVHDFVSVNPGAVVSGEVEIETGVLIGANSAVLQGLRVGTWSTVGAAACAVRDVAAHAIVKGVPAR